MLVGRAFTPPHTHKYTHFFFHFKHERCGSNKHPSSWVLISEKIWILLCAFSKIHVDSIELFFLITSWNDDVPDFSPCHQSHFEKSKAMCQSTFQHILISCTICAAPPNVHNKVVHVQKKCVFPSKQHFYYLENITEAGQHAVFIRVSFLLQMNIFNYLMNISAIRNANVGSILKNPLQSSSASGNLCVLKRTMGLCSTAIIYIRL